MRKRLAAAVSGWPFLIALCLLLANDWWLKAAHPGWLSGKLSDFAGLALAGIVLLAAWPRRFGEICAGLAAAWLWWKSACSSSAIETFNALAPYRIGRTVDYSDLLALAVLPLCRLAVVRRKRLALSAPAARRWLAPPLALAAVLACAASAVPYSQQYGVRSRASAARMDRVKVVEALNAVAAQYQLRCESCDPALDKGVYEGGGKHSVLLRYQFSSNQEVRFDIWTVLPCVFNGGERERLEAMRDSIRYQMAQRIPGLDYLEPIN
ncbi:hypothetical protein [Chromobacterium subtsugae]|uniref:hypothetical protein n=1 Tax=Chromobacterium subtsugae TaxID=251747 RepID=UPI0007F8B941|nr:hypothetical protein [Chromobacterium subtsugae]OBU86335.1 hypothetical protein MY55_11820 [Chromobacterium subtsugae]